MYKCKTAQEAAREYSGCKYAGTDLCNYSPGLTCDPADCYAFKRFNAFLAGVRWAEEWISVSEELPEKYSILLFEVEHAKGIKELHLGTWNGRAWVSVDGCSFLANSKMYTVTDWRPIERKTIDSGREPK